MRETERSPARRVRNPTRNEQYESGSAIANDAVKKGVIDLIDTGCRRESSELMRCSPITVAATASAPASATSKNVR